jgi:hypothetical protein
MTPSLLFTFLLLSPCVVVHAFSLSPSLSNTNTNYAVKPVDLLVDGLPSSSPLLIGLGHISPSFSWALHTAPPTRGASQSSALVEVSTDSIFSTSARVCQVLVIGAQNTTAICAGTIPAFSTPNILLYWRVCVTAADLSSTVSCSATNSFGTGLINAATQWFSSNWISSSIVDDITRPVRLRALADFSTLIINSTITRATIFTASPAYYQLFVEGTQITDGSRFGSAAEFRARVFADAWDVTPSFIAGNGVAQIGIRLGPGWWQHNKNYLAKQLPFKLQVHVDAITASGVTVQYNLSRSLTWTAASDSILFAQWYQGEIVDARLDETFAGWDTQSYQPPANMWQPAITTMPSSLVASDITMQDFPRIHQVALLTPSSVAIPAPQPNTYLFRFDQMFAGTVTLTIPSPSSARGTTIIVSAGELLYPNGTLDNELLSATNQSVSWTLAGNGGVENITTRWCFWGLQFVSVTGWPSDIPPPTINSLVGTAYSSVGEQMSFISFNGVVPSARIAIAALQGGAATAVIVPSPSRLLSLSGGGARERGITHERSVSKSERTLHTPLLLDTEIIAGVQHALYWGIQSNWFSVPSDCPTREKRGWMGDGAASVATMTRNFDVRNALLSWARSMGDDQDIVASLLPAEYQGSVSFIVPSDGDAAKITDAAWSWAVTEAPFQVAAAYGDIRAVKNARVRIARLLSFYQRQAMNSTNPHGLMKDQALFGDWCAAFNRSLYQAQTKGISAAGSWLAMLTTAADWATAANDSKEATKFYAARAAAAVPFRTAFAINNEINGSWCDGIEQAPPVIALGLGSDIAGNKTAAWLIRDIETTQGLHQTTGSVATRLLYPLLTSLGRTDLAAVLTAQSTYPSPGAWLAQGGTTCWEDYSGVADGTHPPPPTHNHPFLCSHGYWLFDVLLGIQDGSSSGGSDGGLSSILFSPPILADLPSMKGSRKLAGKGVIALSWAWVGGAPGSGGLAQVNVSVPPTSLATCRVPVPGLGASASVLESGNNQVWAGGVFVPGTIGVYSAALTTDGLYIEFSIGSGDFAFAVGVGSSTVTPSPHWQRSCALWEEGKKTQTTIQCPLLNHRIHYIPRSGFVQDSDAALDFVKEGLGVVGGPISQRFAATAALEKECLGQHTCDISQSLSEAALGPIEEGDGKAPHFCVSWSCA